MSTATFTESRYFRETPNVGTPLFFMSTATFTESRYFQETPNVGTPLFLCIPPHLQKVGIFGRLQMLAHHYSYRINLYFIPGNVSCYIDQQWGKN